MTKEQAAKKLKGLKALAERGVGGEKETAQRLYKELKEKYEVDEESISQEEEKESISSGIDLFRGAMLGMALNNELESCNNCPYQTKRDMCEECGTYENIKDICLQWEQLKRKG